jgi:dipeptidase
MAESTTSSVFGAYRVGEENGTALLGIREMSLLGLERCKTARDAVQLMGDLAVKHGFYGDCPIDNCVGGEAMYVSDPEEVWVFHVLPDDTHTSAIWAAEKIPDSHISMMANMFIIRYINLTDSAKFLFSDNMVSIAEAKGWWKGDNRTPFDFTAIYSDGEYSHKYYSGRRVWAGYESMGAQGLSPEYDDLRVDSPYPVSLLLPSSQKVGLSDVFRVLRNYYQGTEYDMAVGMGGGPFGNPNRYGAGNGEKVIQGNWERSIAQYRTSDSYVVQSRNWMDPRVGSVVWYGPHAALGTCYTPFAAGMQALPDAFSMYSNPSVFDRKSMYWAARFASNLATEKWLYAGEIMASVQSNWQTAGLQVQSKVDENWTDKNSAQVLTQEYNEFALQIVDYWWSLSDQLMFTFSDGYFVSPNSSDSAHPHVYSLGYPAWWLNSTDVGYVPGPM